MTQPISMRAVTVTGYGAPGDALALSTLPTPKPTPATMLIRVEAAALNPHDYKTVRGEFRRWRPLSFPCPIGGDVCGEVVAVGEGVTRFRRGDRVFGVVHGALAEYAIAAENEVSLVPEGVSPTEAASLPVVGLTTLQAFERGLCAKGERALVYAGSGGVGTFAIQYAKALGMTLTATTSGPNAGLVRSLGADFVVDYRDHGALDRSPPVDFVLDTLGGPHTLEALGKVVRGGRVVGIAPSEMTPQFAREIGLPTAMELAFGLLPSKIARLERSSGATYQFMYVRTNRPDQLSTIRSLVERGAIRPVVDRVYPLARAVDGFEYLETGRARGKVVVTVTP